MDLSEDVRLDFATRGYIVVPSVVPEHLLITARTTVDARLKNDPQGASVRGVHSLWIEDEPALRALLFETSAFDLAAALVAPRGLEISHPYQVALTISPYGHRPGGGHLDGFSITEPDGRPGTFTLLAGVMLSDQSQPDSGNLWVWPGTHRTHAAYFREEHSLEELVATGGHFPIALPAPEQVLGHPGDLLLAHYMLSHNTGCNLSAHTRCTVYVRLRCTGHRDHWEDCLRDEAYEFRTQL
ncbi:MAG: phytanoyl-CoA dioxygenase family protein [Candidatus Dormibacteria bacterium]